MQKTLETTELQKKIIDSYSFKGSEKEIIDKVFSYDLDFLRINSVINDILFYKLGGQSVLAFLCYQLYKQYPQEAEILIASLNEEIKNMIEEFKLIKDINQLTVSEEIDDIRRMFLVMGKDMRVVMIKLFGIYYDISVLENPLDESQKRFVGQVEEIHIPLSERLGLDGIKQKLYDNVVRLKHPNEYNELKIAIESKREENEEQLRITKEKISQILKELKIDGEIVCRIKHISSIFNKLHNNNRTLDQIYDILAMRVIVDSVEECYSVLGRIHGIYKPMAGRVKDYIANPKPNGYKSLHTTIIVENQHPMEIQIRTREMHRDSEYGVYAHWLYKEKKDKKTNFDNRLTWFRQTIENAKNMSDEDFVETLKGELYSGVIVVQTPKGRVLEFPEGATAIDFAYAIHTDVGNYCVGARINGKLRPITTQLKNGDIVEIITNQNSKGPSRDWINVVKTPAARSKIRVFFKNELKDENIKLGRSMFIQACQDKGMTAGQLLSDKYLAEILRKYNADNVDEIYASIGSGTLAASQVVTRLINLYNSDNRALPANRSVVNLKRNKEGVLIDGDSGMLVRFAGCCNPIEGDDIVGYISRGNGVSIHRQNCANIKYLEPERLIDAKWQIKENQTFTANIKVIAEKAGNNIGKITNLITGLKIAIRGFDAKDVGDTFICTLIIDVKNKAELESAISAIKGIKNVIKVYRSER